MKKSLLCMTLSIVMSVHASAAEIATLFTDHMVLQRDKPVNVWGTGAPGETVRVVINNVEQTTTVTASGNWTLSLPAQAKGGPYTLSVQGDNTLSFDDGWYGDVWIAAGQSNMEWDLKDHVTGNEKALAEAGNARIRLYDVPNTLSPEVQTTLPESKWQVANASTAGASSAVAWFFAEKVSSEEDVMVGIIETNWGGTPAEAWIDLATVETVPGYREQAEAVKRNPDWAKTLRDNDTRNTEKWRRIDSEAVALATGAAEVDYDDSQWPEVTLPNSTPFTEFTWLRHTFTLTDDDLSKSVTINVGDIVQNAFVFINGHVVAKEDWRNGDSLHHLPEKWLRRGKNVFAIRVTNDWDNKAYVGRPAQIWREVGSEKVDISGQWRGTNTIEPPVPEVENYTFTPGFLYNAMINPLLPYRVKGVIWYQGESNVDRQEYYADLFKTLIRTWRKKADGDTLPFLFVQLSAFLKPQALQPDSAWAYLRDAQKETLSLPDTGMAVSIDVGNPDDIHPKNKRPVGERLWRQAARQAYGHQDTVTSGPDFSGMDIKGDKVTLRFSNAEGLTTTEGNAPAGFIIAGEDKRFFLADAELDGETIILTNANVKKPVAVRYAWADYPVVNLVNGEGLPAVPFRTDNWTASSVTAGQ